ncbi:MAG: ExbD/TolR family protein [Phycisphaerae bacterium]
MATTTKKKIEGDESVHYEPQRKKRKKRTSMIQPPLTPMIDVTFQLLIFFIITTDFRPEEGLIPGSLPEKGSGASVAVDLMDIRVVVRPSGAGAQYLIERSGESFDTPGQLADFFAARHKALGAEADKQAIVIEIRSDVKWRYVTEAFNAAVKARFRNIGFAVK